MAEAQEIGEMTVEAAQKMGELLLQIQTAQGKRTDITSADNADEVKTKTQVISDIGMERHQANEYQQMAQNPEAVQAAIQKAIDNGDVIRPGWIKQACIEITDMVQCVERSP